MDKNHTVNISAIYNIPNELGFDGLPEVKGDYTSEELTEILEGETKRVEAGNGLEFGINYVEKVANKYPDHIPQILNLLGTAALVADDSSAINKMKSILDQYDIVVKEKGSDADNRKTYVFHAMDIWKDTIRNSDNRLTVERAMAQVEITAEDHPYPKCFVQALEALTFESEDLNLEEHEKITVHKEAAFVLDDVRRWLEGHNVPDDIFIVSDFIEEANIVSKRHINLAAQSSDLEQSPHL